MVSHGEIKPQQQQGGRSDAEKEELSGLWEVPEGQVKQDCANWGRPWHGGGSAFLPSLMIVRKGRACLWRIALMNHTQAFPSVEIHVFIFH